MIKEKQILINISLMLIFLLCGVPSKLLGQENSQKTNDNNSGISNEFRDYLINVNSEVQKKWILPENVKFPEGTLVSLVIKVNKNGQIINVKMKEKSSDEYFNNLALETVKKSTPFPPLPASVKQEEVEIGLKFTPKKEQSDCTRSDTYYNYVADLHLHASHQARNPKHMTQYTEGEEGRLLRSLLDPVRLREVLNSCPQSAERSARIAYVTRLFGPVFGQYEAAFKQQPKDYESEYLDCLEDLVTLQSSAMMSLAISLPSTNRPQGKMETEQKAIAESKEVLAKSMRELTATINRQLAADIRNKIAMRMFTDNGAKRALAIVERLTPP